MTIGQRAMRILEQAEDDLRTLVAEAAANGDYASVVRLASWAQTVAGLVKAAGGQGAGNAQPEESLVDAPKGTSTRHSPRTVANRRESKKAYPRFFRQDNQLVKVGWSKREKKEYQHRAPQVVLTALASALTKIGVDGRVFSTDRVVPLKDSADNVDIPTYQVYVCLALLRQVGLINQHGRQGYSIPDIKEFAQAVESAWRDLPES
jgi:hypothetical protein